MPNFSFVKNLRWGGGWVRSGGFQVSTMSNLNPSYFKLLCVELGLGFDNCHKVIDAKVIEGC